MFASPAESAAAAAPHSPAEGGNPTRARRPIDRRRLPDGYLKDTADEILVVEINDNPNIEHGVEDAAEKDQVWVELTRWLIDRFAA